MSQSPVFILYTRENCHLCEEMHDELHASMRERPYQIDIRDIDSCSDWLLRYGSDIPVLTSHDGTEICRHEFDRDALNNYLSKQDYLPRRAVP